jgi:hypothetical protein
LKEDFVANNVMVKGHSVTLHPMLGDVLFADQFSGWPGWLQRSKIRGSGCAQHRKRFIGQQAHQ